MPLSAFLFDSHLKRKRDAAVSMAAHLLSSAPRLYSFLFSSSFLRPITGSRAFSYCDDFGRVLRDQERAHEAVYILKRDRELEELLRKERQRLDQVRSAIIQIQEYVESQKLFEFQIKDDKLIYRTRLTG